MKLLTKAIEKKLLSTPLGSTDGQGKNAKVIVKFFYPYGVGTWLATEGERQEDGDWMFYGAAEIGMGFEWGYFTLNELKSVVKFGRPAIEREMYGSAGTIKDAWSD